MLDPDPERAAHGLSIDEVRRMAPEARVVLSLRMTEHARAAFAEAHGLDLERAEDRRAFIRLWYGLEIPER